MLDFDAIIGMDWLAACYATVDCRAKTVRFSFPGKSVLEWVGNTATPRVRFISYLKVRKMITKWCIYHIVRVRDVDAEIPTLQSILVVKKYADVFPDELPGIPLKREIDFGIDLLLGTQPISIPPCEMALAELKELKEQLKNLLEKCFIRPSTSPWGVQILFVHKKDDSLMMCIKVDTQKIEVVKSWPRPTTPIEVRRGFFFPFCTIDEVDVETTKFQWTEDCEQSFQELKNKLISAPVLTLPEGPDGYAMYCDALGVGLECVLMQHEKVIADSSLAQVEDEKGQLIREIHLLACLGVRLVDSDDGGVVLQNTTKSSLIDEVKERYRSCLCVPDVVGLRDRIMSEAHYLWYYIYRGSTKMYHDIKDVYCWNNMKKNIAEFVA
ncbi:uncharacterized protein [Nicotiana sylvestris]|uniref:uncharacterized protein n=1 Tax=Nicotiana sylvestris TaxID=4096 RepID=UPI00388C59A2